MSSPGVVRTLLSQIISTDMYVKLGKKAASCVSYMWQQVLSRSRVDQWTSGKFEDSDKPPSPLQPRFNSNSSQNSNLIHERLISIPAQVASVHTHQKVQFVTHTCMHTPVFRAARRDRSILKSLCPSQFWQLITLVFIIQFAWSLAWHMPYLISYKLFMAYLWKRLIISGVIIERKRTWLPNRLAPLSVCDRCAAL